jgi:predicted deacylase
MSDSNNPWAALAAGERLQAHWPTGLEEAPALPLLVVRGRRPGPVVLATGAVHGDEYEGSTAIYTLYHSLDAEQVQGVGGGLPIVNGAAWAARSRTTPHDGGDLNQAFPGGAAGLTQRLAEVIFTHFVRRCDLLLDLHSGGARLVHLPMIGWYAGGTEAEALARSFGGGLHPWLIGGRAGVLSYEAHRAGKIALGAEWGGGARLDPAGAAAYAEGIQALVSGAPAATVDHRPPLSGSYQTTEAGGLFVPDVALGQRVQAGAPLGLLYDSLGQEAARPEAERAGIIAALPHLAWLYPHDRIAYIG